MWINYTIDKDTRWRGNDGTGTVTGDNGYYQMKYNSYNQPWANYGNNNLTKGDGNGAGFSDAQGTNDGIWRFGYQKF